MKVVSSNRDFCQMMRTFYSIFESPSINFLWGSPIREGGRRDGKKEKGIREGRSLTLEAKGNEGFSHIA